MTIRNLWDMYIGWKPITEARVYKGTKLIYEGVYRRMTEQVLHAQVHLFEMKDGGLVIFIMENEDE